MNWKTNGYYTPGPGPGPGPMHVRYEVYVHYTGIRMYRYMYMYIYVYSIHLSSSSWRNVDELCTKFGRTNDSRGPHDNSHTMQHTRSVRAMKTRKRSNSKDEQVLSRGRFLDTPKRTYRTPVMKISRKRLSSAQLYFSLLFSWYTVPGIRHLVRCH